MKERVGRKQGIRGEGRGQRNGRYMEWKGRKEWKGRETHHAEMSGLSSDFDQKFWAPQKKFLYPSLFHGVTELVYILFFFPHNTKW